MTNIYEKLRAVQVELHAPKNQFNAHGKYKYRSAEDILEGLKPVLDKHGLTLTVTDSIELVGDRYYVRATAAVSDGESTVAVDGWARETLDRKGMDSSQITGATSSYARKYAMNGLFAIDDSKDADSGVHENAPKRDSGSSTGRTAPSKPPLDGRIAELGQRFQNLRIPPEDVKAKLAELGYGGLSQVDDPTVLDVLDAWAREKSWPEGDVK